MGTRDGVDDGNRNKCRRDRDITMIGAFL